MSETGPAQRLLIATHNAHKTREFREMLGARFQVLALSEVPASFAPEESGETFEENAQIKAIAASLNFDGIVLADDSGLEVDSLAGAPGVESARYSGANATDATNREKLLAELEKTGVRGKERSARFRCVIAIARKGQALATFSGAVEGVINNGARGDGGFGYDPLFVPDGYCETFAQLPSEVKHRLSHRGRALKQAVEWLEEFVARGG